MAKNNGDEDRREIREEQRGWFDQNTYVFEIIEQYKTILVRLDKVWLAGGERDRRELKG